MRRDERKEKEFKGSWESEHTLPSQLSSSHRQGPKHLALSSAFGGSAVPQVPNLIAKETEAHAALTYWKTQEYKGFHSSQIDL